MLKYKTDKKEIEKLMKMSEKEFKNISKIKKGEVLIAEGNRKEIYFVSKKLMNLYKKISKEKHPYTIGFYFGRSKKGKIKFSLETLYEYAKKTDNKKITISRKEEMRFLYGRDVRAGQIRDIEDSIKIGDKVIICNLFNEAIGMGEVILPIKNAKRSQRVIKNIIDRGWYLRHKE